MSRWFLALLVASMASLSAYAQQEQPQPAPKQEELKRHRPQPPVGKEEEVAPPEEDTDFAPTEYSFNPLQAEREVRTGNYYFKKGSYRAAANRFREATKWNDGYGEAWLRLGEAEERLKDGKAAKDAYVKYLAVAPDAKNAGEVRKKLGKLK